MMGFFPTGSSSPPLCICLSFFLSLFVSYSLTVIKMNVSKSQKSSRDAGEQNGAGEPLCTLMETLVLCIPPVPKGQPCLFHSICVSCLTCTHRLTQKEKKKGKISSSPWEEGTLRQLLWMAEKQWSTFVLQWRGVARQQEHDVVTR